MDRTSVGTADVRSAPSGAPLTLGGRRRHRLARLGARLASVLWVLAVGGALALLVAVWTAGWRLERIETASMEPTVPPGSLAVVTPVNPQELQAGDVVSFRDPGDRSRRILHRIVRVIHQSSGTFFVTQGDANATPDPRLVPTSDVQGELRWHVPRLGRLAWALRPPLGLAVLAGIPALVIGASEFRRRRRRRRGGPAHVGRTSAMADDRSDPIRGQIHAIVRAHLVKGMDASMDTQVEERAAAIADAIVVLLYEQQD